MLFITIVFSKHTSGYIAAGDALAGANVPTVRRFSATASPLQLSENRTVYRR